jgi:fructose/tagatose bisphosphate aldolase
MSNGILDIVKPGVLFGEDVQKVYEHAKAKGFAIPAVNVVNTDSINGVLEAAAKVKSPVIIQFSNGGASYFAGKGLSNENENAAIVGAIAGANMFMRWQKHMVWLLSYIQIMLRKNYSRGSMHFLMLVSVISNM